MRGGKKQASKTRRVCCVPSCNNTNDLKLPGGNFYAGKYVHFPTNEERRNIWIESLQLTFTPNNGHYVCCEHFNDDAWSKQDVLLNVPVMDRKLRNGAVPVLEKNKTNADAKDQEYALDVETRKRLVAEALASYEQDLNKEASVSTAPKKVTRRKRRSVSTSSDTSLESTLSYMLRDEDSNSIAEIVEDEQITMPTAVVDEHTVPKTIAEPKIEYELIDETTIHKEYKKFGEIMIDMEDLSYALNCSYCEHMFFEMLDFKNHVQEQHKKLLNIYEGEIKESTEVIMVSVTEETIDLKKEPHELKEPIVIHENTHQQQHIKQEAKQELMETNNAALIFEEEQVFECPETELLFIEETDQQLFIEEENNDEKKLSEKELIELVIALWKKYEVLWDKSHADYNKTKVQKLSFETMFNEIKTITQLKSFNVETLRGMCSDLTNAYHEDLHAYRSLSKYRKKEFKPKYWFFYKLNFLNEKFSYLRNVDDEVKVATHLSVDISTRQKELVLMEIIELYEEAKPLWHVTDPAYEGKLANKTVLQELYAKLKEKNIHVYLRSEHELGELLKSLTRWFSAVEYLRHTAKIEEKTDSKTAASTFVCGHPTVYESLLFLQHHVAPYRCSVCQQVYFSEYTYLKHIRSKKNNCNMVMEAGAHECEYCQKRFKRLCELRCHVRLHTNERPYECKICLKRFRNYATWYRHKRTHTTIKPHECSYCKRKYHCKNLLESHLKTHLDIRDHVCDICGKAFTWSRYLNRHRITHLTERNFPCPECGNRYKSKDLLNAHLRRCRQRRQKQEEIDEDMLAELDETTEMFGDNDSADSIKNLATTASQHINLDEEESSFSQMYSENDSDFEGI